jgi:hypothetical protein
MKANHFHIEKITVDNRRPGMPQKGFLVRYQPSDDHGWLCCKALPTMKAAKEFANNLDK